MKANTAHSLTSFVVRNGKPRLRAQRSAKNSLRRFISDSSSSYNVSSIFIDGKEPSRRSPRRTTVYSARATDRLHSQHCAGQRRQHTQDHARWFKAASPRDQNTQILAPCAWATCLLSPNQWNTNKLSAPCEMPSKAMKPFARTQEARTNRNGTENSFAWSCRCHEMAICTRIDIPARQLSNTIKTGILKVVLNTPREYWDQMLGVFHSVGKWSPNPDSSPHSLRTRTRFHAD